MSINSLQDYLDILKDMEACVKTYCDKKDGINFKDVEGLFVHWSDPSNLSNPTYDSYIRYVLNQVSGILRIPIAEAKQTLDFYW